MHAPPPAVQSPTHHPAKGGPGHGSPLRAEQGRVYVPEESEDPGR